MPNTAPVADNAGTIQLIKDSAARSASVRVYPTGCITVGMKGQALAPIGSLKRAGVVAITDDGDCVQSNELMRRACEYAKMFGLPLMDHCQDHSMTVGAVMNEGEMSVRLGLRGWPNAAEDLIVARNCILSEYTGAHIHMQHLSSRNAVEILRRAKSRGVKVSGEACPHHLALTDACLAGYDTHFKMNPPLRTEEDRLAIIAGLRDGTIDILATDHAPHTPDEKDREFDLAPNGILGLETALAVTLDILVRQNRFKLSTLVDLWTRKPAALLGLPAGTLGEGAPADLTLFDPQEEWTYDAKTGFSKSANSPWSGTRLRGRVRATYVGGRQVYECGRAPAA
jgi:dihydroorotase